MTTLTKAMTDEARKTIEGSIKLNKKVMGVIEWLPKAYLGLTRFEIDIDPEARTVLYRFLDSKGDPLIVKCKDIKVLEEFMPMKTGLKSWKFMFEEGSKNEET